MSEQDYYASTFGGWVCRRCGCLVHERDTHDEWHQAATSDWPFNI